MKVVRFLVLGTAGALLVACGAWALVWFSGVPISRTSISTQSDFRPPLEAPASKRTLVTGATSGIGERTAELFVAEGARVFFTGRRQPQGEAIAKRLGANASFFPADATEEADWKRLIAHVLDRHGRLDALFNNAGGPAPT